MPAKIVDIIIPVYNAYDYLVDCVESVLKHTSYPHRIIIIDDKSPDSRIALHLDRLKKLGRPNLVIKKNRQNLGFVKTCNKGMRLSKKNDIILLNSDTIVTKNWLKKIRRCAYSNDKIATVTPFSNNATICSIPKFNEGNSVPAGYSIDSYGELIEQVSKRKYPELPTAVGFCMYIKRKVLKEIGYFDEKHFGKGYCEENDFCMRALKAGFKHVLSDDTYIYHHGSASFLPEKWLERVLRHEKVLLELHPDYFPMKDKFMETNPLKELQDNIKSNTQDLTKDKAKIKILHVMHYESIPGGIGLHVQQFVRSIKIHSIYILHPTRLGDLRLERWSNNQKIGEWNYHISKKFNQKTIKNSEYDNILKQILITHNMSIVHFHCLVGLPVSMLKIPCTCGIKSVLTLHDYSLISTIPTLVDNISKIDKAKQSKFFDNAKDYVRYAQKLASENRQAKFELKRIAFIKDALTCIDTIVSPSKFAQTQYESIYPNLDIKVIEHWSDLPKSTDTANIQSGRITVAFLGAGAEHKGIIDFVKIVSDPKIKRKFNWKIIGFPNPALEPKFKKIKLWSAYNSIYKIGHYPPMNLPAILKKEKVNLIILPSPYSETYSYTLSESIQCSIPVLVRNVGALGERVKGKNFGWTFNDVPEAVNILMGISKNRSKLIEKSGYIRKISMPMVGDIIPQYIELYTSNKFTITSLVLQLRFKIISQPFVRDTVRPMYLRINHTFYTFRKRFSKSS